MNNSFTGSYSSLKPKSLCPLLLRTFIILFFCFTLAPSAILKAQSSAEYKWNNVAIGAGGFVSAIVTSKSEQGLMYARTDVGGAYRWDPANKEWIPLLDWVSQNQSGYLGVESLSIDEQDPDRVYMLVGISYFNGGNTAILRSNDRGNTFSIVNVSSLFKAHGNGMGRQTGEKLAIDPHSSNILYCGTRWNGLFKSTNYGETWSRISTLDVTTTPNENGISFVLIDPKSGSPESASQTLYVGVSRMGSTNLYRSSDGGATFAAVSGAPTNLMPQRAALASDGNLYITYSNGAGPHPHWAVPEPADQGSIWKYNTGNGTWTNVTPNNLNRAFGGISIDPNNPNRLVASTINTWMLQYESAYGDRIFVSSNGGANWTDVVARGFSLDPNGVTWIEGHAIHWAGSIEFDPFDTKKVWVTSGNGIFTTDNIDASTPPWRFEVKGLEETVPLDLISIPNGPLISVIGDYDGFTHTAAEQYAPIHKPQMGTTTGLAVANKKPEIRLRAGDKIFYTLNSGQSWTEASSQGKKGHVAISADGNVFLHCPENSSVTYRSTNRGTSWTAVTGLSINNARPVADPENPNKFYAYNPADGKLWVSTNGGSSFAAAGSTNSGGSRIIRTAPGKEGHIWVALNGGGLARSTNSGQSFSKISGVSASHAIGLGMAYPGSTYYALYIWGTVGGVTGLFRSTNEGSSWVRVNDDQHQYGGPGNGQFVVGDMNVPGRVYMSTAGRGIVYGEPAAYANCPPTSISPFLQLNNGSWQPGFSAQANTGDQLKLDPRIPQSEGGSWSWTGPNGFASSEAVISLQNLQASQAGEYTVTFTNNCGTASTRTISISVQTVTSVPELGELEKGINIYPNPSPSGSFAIDIPLLAKEAGIQLYDQLGRLQSQHTVSSGKGLQLHTKLPAGIYLLRITMLNVQVSRKLVIY